MNCPVEVTKTCKVASARVLVASTRRRRLEVVDSARADGDRLARPELSEALRETLPRVAVMRALVVTDTGMVVTVKLAEVAPAGTVTLAGTIATELLLFRLTTVAFCARTQGRRPRGVIATDDGARIEGQGGERDARSIRGVDENLEGRAGADTASARSGLPSLLKSDVTSLPPPMLEKGGGTA